MKGITKGRKGSAIVLSLIVVMLLMILCSTIMAFTLQNLKQSEQYKKMVFGYYSSEENLEAGLKKIQDDLKTIDTEAFNYIKDKKGFTSSSYDITNMSDDMKALLSNTISSNMTAFYSKVNSIWTDIYNNHKNLDDFGAVSSKFLTDVYKRYYFLLVHEVMGNTDYKNLITGSSYLNSTASDIDVTVPDFTNMINYENDASYYVYGEPNAYSPTDAENVAGSKTYSGTNAGIAKYNTINIVYVKNNDKTDAVTNKAIEQNSIKTKLVLKVPDVDFTVKTQMNYTKVIGDAQYSSTSNIEGDILMGDAIVSYGNFVVRDGAVSNVFGDMFVKGRDVTSSDGDQYASNTDFPDMNQTTVLDPNENKGGIRVGIPNQTLQSKLLLRGTAYTSEYIHTLGKNSAIDVCAYDTSTNPSVSVNETKGIQYYKGNEFRDLDTTTTPPYAPKAYCIDYNEYGGDVFCKKLVTEEIADGSTIRTFGRAFVAGNLQADAENPPSGLHGIDGIDPTKDDDNLTSSVEIGGDYYGLNSGYDSSSGTFNTDTLNNLHSAIIQNGANATIKLDAKVYVPSVVYLLTTQLGAGKNYKTAESITAAQDDTLNAYSNQTDYTYSLGAGAALNNTDYTPFSFYTFSGSNDLDSLKKSTKQFLSYFTDSTKTLPKSNITWNKGGWILGVGLIKRSSGINAEIIANSSVDDETDPAKRLNYVKDNSKVTFIPYVTQEFPESTAYNNCLNNLVGSASNPGAFVKKTKNYYYQDGAAATHPKLDVTANGINTAGPNGFILNETDALVVKDKPVDIKSDGVYVDGSKTNFAGSGVILTNNDVTVEGGNIKGLIATNGDVVVKGNSTIAYSEDTVKSVIDKYSQVARALGATVTIEKSHVSGTNALTVTSGYHVDSMSRFTRTEWTEND